MLNPGGGQSAQRQSDPPASFANRQGPPPANFGAVQPIQTAPSHQSHASQPFNQMPTPSSQQHERSFSGGPMMQQYGSTANPPRGPPQSAGGYNNGPPAATGYNSGSVSASGPPQLSSLPFQTSQTPPPSFPQQQQQAPQPSYAQKQNQGPYSQSPSSAVGGPLPPLKPVFGLTLEQLFERDMTAVPMVVSQCIQAVDLFGLEVEGIYRVSGTASHIAKIKAMFDNGKSTSWFLPR